MALVKIKETLGSTVNIGGVHLAPLLTDKKGEAPEYGDIIHLQGTQDIKIDKDQEQVDNWGDGEVQESAVSQGKTKVDVQNFAFPLEVRAFLAGAEVDEDGTVIERGGVVDPPPVGITFYKQRKNKDLEVIALTRGTFTVSGDEGKTAEEKIEFSNDSMSGEFSPRISDGIKELRKYIEKDDYAALDKFFNTVYGKPAPATFAPLGWKVRPAGV